MFLGKKRVVIGGILCLLMIKPENGVQFIIDCTPDLRTPGQLFNISYLLRYYELDF